MLQTAGKQATQNQTVQKIGVGCVGIVAGVGKDLYEISDGCGGDFGTFAVYDVME